VDRAFWPEGLGPLAARVHELGMQLGLWFEPEMVNLDSELARAHPEWLLHAPDDREPPAGVSWRNQHVLDLADPDAYAHILGLVDGLVSELGIDFIKWDHNRDLVDARHEGRPGVHAQTLAALRMMDELHQRHPGLEIESCSSGGARADLGVLEVTDRVWASDANDAVERQDIQRWTGLLLPPELVGGHVGPSPAHNSGRVLPFAFRAATSLMGSAGFELNLLELDEAELADAARFGELYRELRQLIHTGTAVHPDGLDPALRVRGFVAPDRAEAVYTVASLGTLEEALSARVRLPGLDPTRRYRLRVRDELGGAEHGWITPEWLADGELTTTGAVLAEVGLQLPTLFPFQALVLHLTPGGSGGDAAAGR
ncbi:alpha-galactosidase, partial [Schumannella luteola]